VASKPEQRGLGGEPSSAAAPAERARVTAAAAPAATPPRSRLAGIGLAGGVMSGLLGVGGGLIMVPLLVLRGRYGQRDAHALSLGAIIPISAAAAATYAAAGEVRLWEAAALAIGAIAGANVGAAVLSRASERALKGSFGVFLLVVAATMAIGR
jgi:uncharacterized protein